MKGKVYSVDGSVVGEVDLPVVFDYGVRKDLIMKAFLAEQSKDFQLKYPNLMAGKRKVVFLTKQRRSYRTTYGRGMTRTPKKVTYRLGEQFVYVGAFAPNTVGGREAHPPTPNKVLVKRINKKEREAAIKSAISASVNKDLVSKLHKVENVQLPIIFDDKINEISKTKDIEALLSKVGLSAEINRIKEKRIRAGKGKMRGRRYKKKVGPIIITTDKKNLEKAARNLNVQVINVKEMTVKAVSHAGLPGRLIIWTKGALNKL